MSKLCRYLLVFVAPMLAQQVSPTINQFASREFGQAQLLPSLVSVAPNLVEGRELNGPFSIAFDTSSSPPILYVADTGNNRVLAWKNPTALGVCGITDPTCGFADPLVIGQRDRFSTLSGGPGRVGLNTGFLNPSAIAVDGSGNLYVADTGNNRILRFPAPFKQTGSLLQPDLVIGQKTANFGVSPNEGNQLPSAKTLYLSSGPGPTAIALDSTGGLWVPDTGNNRALRFPASQLAAGTVEPVADIVLGQLDFQTAAERPAPQGQLGGSTFFKGNLLQPAAVAIAANGGMYISDGHARVLYYLPGIASGSVGISAFRILGLGYNIQGQTPLTQINNYILNTSAPGLMVSGNNLYVADVGGHRVVKYDAPDNWPAESNLQSPITTQFSPPMIDVVGQVNLSSGKINKGQPEPDATTLRQPVGGAFLGTDLWIADTGNHRVVSFPLQGAKYVTATRLVGQLDWPYNSPNLIEGREVNFNFNGPFAGVVIDTNSTPPHLYVADFLNNRVLGFNDARNIPLGSKADLVIGQKDFYRSLINGATNDPQLPNQLGLQQPTGLAVDANGNLFVADTGNGRVLRFPSPFSQTSGQQLPNLVLGQSGFSSQFFDPSISSMAGPVGLALFSDGSLAVSDVILHRVMIFKKQGADFQNGQVASAVLGQPNPNSSNASNSAAGMNSPRQIAVDSSDRLYVADFGNSRLLVWTNARNQTTGAGSAAQFNNIGSPQGVVISQITGEIWISNSSNSQILRLPEFNTLILNSTPTNYPITGGVQAQTAAAAITLDASDNLIVAESANRVAFYYAALTFRHAATYNQQPIAPGMLVSLARLGKDLALTAGSAQTLPWPPIMNDIQVTVNKVVAPIYGMASGIINIQVPTQNMPTSGTVEFLVLRPSTGEILSAGVFPMAQYSPGFFTQSGLGTGQVAAFNIPNQGETFTNFFNSPSNPVSRDGNHFIGFCLTGGGVFDGGPDPAPADGAAPVGAPSTHIKPNVVLSPPGTNVPDGDVPFSGGGCGYPGLWQLNVRIPSSIPPGTNNIVVLTMDSIASNVGPSGRIQITYATK